MAISLQRGHFDPKFQVEGVSATNHSSRKTSLNYISCGIKIWTDLSSVLSQCTSLTDRRTDKQTDRILIARPRLYRLILLLRTTTKKLITFWGKKDDAIRYGTGWH